MLGTRATKYFCVYSKETRIFTMLSVNSAAKTVDTNILFLLEPYYCCNFRTWRTQLASLSLSNSRSVWESHPTALIKGWTYLKCSFISDAEKRLLDFPFSESSYTTFSTFMLFLPYQKFHLKVSILAKYSYDQVWIFDWVVAKFHAVSFSL